MAKKKQTILLLSSVTADGKPSLCTVEKLENNLIIVKADKDAVVKVEYQGTDSLEAMSKMQENRNLVYFIVEK